MAKRTWCLEHWNCHHCPSLLFVKSLNDVGLLIGFCFLGFFFLEREELFPRVGCGCKEIRGDTGCKEQGLVGGKTGFTLILICWGPRASYFTALDFVFLTCDLTQGRQGGLVSGHLTILSPRSVLARPLWDCAVTVPLCVFHGHVWVGRRWTLKGDDTEKWPSWGALRVTKWTVEEILLMCVLLFSHFLFHLEFLMTQSL